MKALFRFLASLKLAVLVIVGLVAALSTATVLESKFDTPTAQYLVYQSFWFEALLTLLGINIIMVALSRWPWKKKHTAFLLAHVGIIMVLVGSGLTSRRGLDGNLRIPEGQSASRVELSTYEMQVSDGNQGYRFPIRWIPPGKRFPVLPFSDFGIAGSLRIDQMYSHADVDYQFVPDTSEPNRVVTHPDGRVFSAIHFKIKGAKGSPMRIEQDFWLWGGDSQFSKTQAGPALFEIVAREDLGKDAKAGRAQITFIPDEQGNIAYRVRAVDGSEAKGKITREKSQNVVLSSVPKSFAAKVEVTVLDWLPNSRPLAVYREAKVQYGQQAPPPAVRVTNGTDHVWMGLGDRAMISDNGRQYGLAFGHQSRILPFSIRLDQFEIGFNPGTMDPASYKSHVTVRYCESEPKESRDPERCPEDRKALIQMNEVLTEKGIIFYQASYEPSQNPADPRPTVTILSVNQDPGRALKYWGSLLIVLGSILLFGAKWRARARDGKKEVEMSL